jgi:hypothetical protein
MSLSYDDYLSQVVAYFGVEEAAAFRDKGVWEGMQLEVLELLEEWAT